MVEATVGDLREILEKNGSGRRENDQRRTGDQVLAEATVGDLGENLKKKKRMVLAEGDDS